MLAPYALQVRLDFSSTTLEPSSEGFKVSAVTHAKMLQCDLTPRSRMICEFALAGAPDDRHSFAFVARGAGGDVRTPRLSCPTVHGDGALRGTESSAAAPPSPLAAPLPPILDADGRVASPRASGSSADGDDDPAIYAMCGLGATVSVLTTWQAGYRAAVRVRRWVPHARLTMGFGGRTGPRGQPYDLSVLSLFGASLHDAAGGKGRAESAHADAVEVQLAAAPDREYGGFGFTARGLPPPTDYFVVRCPSVTTAMLTSPPPPPDCELGAAFSFVETWRTGFEAEVSVRSWRAGATFRLDFGTSGAPPLHVLNVVHAIVDTPSAHAPKPAAGRELKSKTTAPSGTGAGGSASSSGGATLPPATRVVEVRLLAGSFSSFRLTARFADSGGSAGTEEVATPYLSCAIAHPPPPPMTSTTPRSHLSMAMMQQGVVKPPARPAAPKLLKATCASVSITWTAPGSAGVPVQEYRVWASREGLPDALAKEGLREPRAELTGLLASTRYSIAVQARGPAGWSAIGVGTEASTQPALRTPAPPFDAPKPASAASALMHLKAQPAGAGGARRSLVQATVRGDDGGDGAGDGGAEGEGLEEGAGESAVGACAAGLLLKLPTLRGGCSGDESLSVEARRADRRDGNAWTRVATRATSREEERDGSLSARGSCWHSPACCLGARACAARATCVPAGVTSEEAYIDASALDAESAWTFRTLAHNAHGSSSAGPPSEALLPHHALSSGVRAPHVEVTGSSTLRISSALSRGADDDSSSTDGLSDSVRVACDVDWHGQFEVLLRHDSSTEWQTLTQVPEAGARLPVEVGSALCGHGCYVRLRLRNVRCCRPPCMRLHVHHSPWPWVL
jgi:hypothetical protein